MANVLDRIMQRVDIESKENDNGRKAYSNMMVYLKELKLHNVKNLELAEQIFNLSENSVEKLNEMRELIAERLDGAAEADAERIMELLKQSQDIQKQVSELTGMRQQMNELAGMRQQMDALAGMSRQVSELAGMQEEMKKLGRMRSELQMLEDRIFDGIQRTTKESMISEDAYERIVQSAMNKTQEQIAETMEKDSASLKKEFSSFNESFDGVLQKRMDALEGQVAGTRKSLTTQIRIVTWLMVAIIALLILQFINI